MNVDPADKRRLLDSMRSATLVENKVSRIKGCFYGDNGVGKTVAAIAAIRRIIGPDPLIVFVDVNEGWHSLRNHASLKKNVKVIPFQSVEQLYVIAEAIFNASPGFENVGGIVLDDADFMANIDLNYLWHKRVEKGGSTLDPDKPERPEYLKLGFRFTEVLEYVFSNTPDVHLMMTAHVGEKKSSDGSVVLKTFPGFNPALTKEIEGRLQFVGYMTATNVRHSDDTAEYTRTVQVHPTKMINAKTRVGCDKMKYEIGEFIMHLAQWSLEGRPTDNEATAIRKELETSKMETEDDMFGSATVVEEDDDTPALVE